MKNKTLLIIGGGIALAYLAKRSASPSLNGLGNAPGDSCCEILNMRVGAAVVTSYDRNGINIYSTNGAGPWLLRQATQYSFKTGHSVGAPTAWKTIGSYATRAEADAAADKLTKATLITPAPAVKTPSAPPGAAVTTTPSAYPNSAPVNPSYQPSASMPSTPVAAPRSKTPLVAAGVAAVAVPIIAFLALR